MNVNTGADDSAFSSENVLNRLSAARSQMSKESNRLFLASLILSGLFLIKASGLRVDLTLLDTNVAKVPHGLFFFLVASQVSMILSYMRSADSAALDSRIREAIGTYGVIDVAASERTFVNDSEWFSTTEAEFSRKKAGALASFLFRTTSLLTSLTALFFYVLPTMCGIYALCNYNILIATGNVSLQFWAIFVTTLLSVLWFVNFIAIWSVVRK